MKKHVIFYILTIGLFFNMQFLNVNANETETTENNTQLIQNLYTQVEQLKYDVLLQREKDISSSLYDFTMFFVVLITLFVTITGVIISLLMYKLNNHQKKIDLVLNSKEFDEKLKQIENRIAEIRLRERESYKNKLISRIYSSIEMIDNHSRSIESLKNNSDFPNALQIIEQHNFEDLKLNAKKIMGEVKKFESVRLSDEDELSNDILPEEYLRQYDEKLSSIEDNLRTLLWHKLYIV